MTASRSRRPVVRFRPDEPAVSHLAILVAVLGGLTLWALHVVAGPVLVPAACEHGGLLLWAIHALTVVTALGAVGCTLLGWRLWQAGDGRRATARTRFLGSLAMLLGALSLLLILTEGAPAFFVDPCAR